MQYQNNQNILGCNNKRGKGSASLRVTQPFSKAPTFKECSQIPDGNLTNDSEVIIAVNPSQTPNRTGQQIRITIEDNGPLNEVSLLDCEKIPNSKLSEKNSTIPSTSSSERDLINAATQYFYAMRTSQVPPVTFFQHQPCAPTNSESQKIQASAKSSQCCSFLCSHSSEQVQATSLPQVPAATCFQCQPCVPITSASDKSEASTGILKFLPVPCQNIQGQVKVTPQPQVSSTTCLQCQPCIQTNSVSNNPEASANILQCYSVPCPNQPEQVPTTPQTQVSTATCFQCQPCVETISQPQKPEASTNMHQFCPVLYPYPTGQGQTPLLISSDGNGFSIPPISGVPSSSHQCVPAPICQCLLLPQCFFSGKGQDDHKVNHTIDDIESNTSTLRQQSSESKQSMKIKKGKKKNASKIKKNVKAGRKGSGKKRTKHAPGSSNQSSSRAAGSPRLNHLWEMFENQFKRPFTESVIDNTGGDLALLRKIPNGLSFLESVKNSSPGNGDSALEPLFSPHQIYATYETHTFFPTSATRE